MNHDKVNIYKNINLIFNNQEYLIRKNQFKTT